MKKFGIDWKNPILRVNNRAIYEVFMSKDDFDKFKSKKGYKVLPYGHDLVYVAPKGYRLTSKGLEIGYSEGKLTLSIDVVKKPKYLH